MFAAIQSEVIPGRSTGPSPEPKNTNHDDHGTISAARFDGRCAWVPGSPASRGPRNDSIEATSEIRAAALLPQMPLGEHVVEDYRSLGLSLKRHPLAFLRAELAREGLAAAADLAHLPVDRRLAIAGIVLIRQRPGSANGVVFITIEDETGVANLIVWPQILERFRRAALGATLLRCTGRLQREESVIHIVADHLADLTPRLNTLRERSGNAEPTMQLAKGMPVANAMPGCDARDIVVRSRNFR